MTTNLTVSAQFTKNNGQPATGLTLSDIKLFLTSQNKSTGVDATVWDGTQVATVEINNVGQYTRILTTADLTGNDYFAMAQYTGATVLDSNYAYGQVSMVEADATAFLAKTLFGRSIQDLILDIWAQVVGKFLADDADEPALITYKAPDDATTQLTHTLTDTTRDRS